MRRRHPLEPIAARHGVVGRGWVLSRCVRWFRVCRQGRRRLSILFPRLRASRLSRRRLPQPRQNQLAPRVSRRPDEKRARAERDARDARDGHGGDERARERDERRARAQTRASLGIESRRERGRGVSTRRTRQRRVSGDGVRERDAACRAHRARGLWCRERHRRGDVVDDADEVADDVHARAAVPGDERRLQETPDDVRWKRHDARRGRVFRREGLRQRVREHERVARDADDVEVREPGVRDPPPSLRRAPGGADGDDGSASACLPRVANARRRADTPGSRSRSATTLAAKKRVQNVPSAFAANSAAAASSDAIPALARGGLEDANRVSFAQRVSASAEKKVDDRHSKRSL